MVKKLQRVGGLFEQVISFENLYFAFRKAAKGAKGKLPSERFFYFLETELYNLKLELENNAYKPAPYHYFTVYEPKERKISVAPFRDRVVHHAIIRVIEPIYEKVFVYDSYATRKNKGTHKAIYRAQQFMRQNKWYFKTDISKYFESINHDILMTILRKKVKDPKLILLLQQIISRGGENGKGLPIGNLTSQFFANVYLDQLDHFLKDQLGIKYYLRYMDDFVIFNENKQELKLLRKILHEFLQEKLKLKMKERATVINQRLHGISFLGTRIFPSLIRIIPTNLRRSVQRLKRKEDAFQSGKMDDFSFVQSANSIMGHLGYFNTYKLRKDIFYG